jgi:predicted ribosomally synthesized peptide with nif11-like leader
VSIDDLTAFFAQLQNDQALQDQARALQGAPDDERLDGLCRLAGEHGFDVTPADWQHEAAGPAIAALDDESLRGVVGGACGEGAGAYGAESLGWGLGHCGENVGAATGPCES